MGDPTRLQTIADFLLGVGIFVSIVMIIGFPIYVMVKKGIFRSRF